MSIEFDQVFIVKGVRGVVEEEAGGGRTIDLCTKL